MVVSTCPSSQFYQLSFHQHLLRFFLNQFLETFRDFADDDDDSFEKEIKASNLQISHQIVSVVILNFLMRWSFCQRRCMRMGALSFLWMWRAQFHVSGLFILDFIIIVIVFVKNSVFLSASFIPCYPLAIYASFIIYRF